MTQRRASVEHLMHEVDTDLHSSAPKVEQIVDLLSGLLANLPEGSEVPSERAIAEHFGVARMTARGAVDRLVALGLVERRARQATIVAAPRYVHIRKLSSYADDMRSRGMVPGGRVVDRRVRSATEDDVRVLGVQRDSSVLHLVRLRTADGSPMAVTRSRISLERFPGLADKEIPDGSLHETLLAGWGTRAAHHEQTADAVATSPQDAKLLGVADGAAALRLIGVSRDAQGETIESAHSVYHAERYQLLMRTGPAAYIS
ncbi:MAG: GntR family transcriptional regulator [Brevibacterium sp.]|nr:GntR family transcriptional regulator [Brachybacterium alimentarium]RCS87841.1 GntR family transcriptional regulator [Brachybacterium alimentarium]RCS87955.1 GntR family transcriptional regulator [Brachybacterium alimentarium]